MVERKPQGGKQEGVSKKTIEEAREFLKSRPSDPEHKEVVPAASIGVKIDTAFLEQKISSSQSEAEKILWETMSKLPNTIDFKPGVTIIIGRNGTGKTTLAKAIYISSLIEREIGEVKEQAAKILVDSKARDEEKSRAAATFKNPHDEARESVLKAPSKNPYLPAPLSESAGLAVELSKAIQTKTVTSNSSAIPDRYVDASSINGIFTSYLHDSHKERTQPQIGVDKEGRTIVVRSTVSQEEADADFRARQAELGSTRQSIDQILKPYLHGNSGYQGPRVVFLDEVEVGADPFRKRHFAEWMQQFVDDEDYDAGNPKSTIISPTNSSALYENQNVPRIDLRFPEAGIFLPKDKPGYYEED